MFKALFVFFLLVHILGDFYFQSDKLAEKKRNSYMAVMLHGLIYLTISILCALPFWSPPMIASAGVLSISHWLTDSIKYLCLRKGKREQKGTAYVVDQLIHLACISIVASLFIHLGFRYVLLSSISKYFSSINMDPFVLIQWIGLILLMIKPANITIKYIVNRYKPREDTLFNANKTGALIGTLERMIILLMLSVAQYAAIGLVLTAKSVARYNKIAEDKNFAEYYLLGTLMSVLYAITMYFLVAQV